MHALLAKPAQVIPRPLQRKLLGNGGSAGAAAFDENAAHTAVALPSWGGGGGVTSRMMARGAARYGLGALGARVSGGLCDMSDGDREPVGRQECMSFNSREQQRRLPNHMAGCCVTRLGRSGSADLPDEA